MHEDHKRRSGAQKPDSSESELNDVWRELLGSKSLQDSRPHGQEASMPVLSTDPWKALAQARGVEEIDLQQIDLQVSDQEVEQALQVMQEQQKPTTNEPGSAKKR